MRTTKSKKIIVYNKLKSRIINGTLEPLTPLNERVISEDLNISKTPIRESLQQLEKEGFVENIHNRGYFVSRISVQDLREIYEIRAMIESEAVKIFISKGLKDKFDFEFPEFNQEKNSHSMLRDSDQIHFFIIQALGNNRLSAIYKSIQEHVKRLQIYFVNKFEKNILIQTHEEHRRIYEAIISDDVVKAEQAVRNHIRNALDYLRT